MWPIQICWPIWHTDPLTHCQLYLSQTPAHTVRPRIQAIVYHAICLFIPPAFARYSFSLPTEGWLRLSRPGCLVLRRDGLPVQWRVTHPGTNRAWRRVTTLIEYRDRRLTAKIIRQPKNKHEKHQTFSSRVGMRRSIPTKLVMVIDNVRPFLQPLTFSHPISSFAARSYWKFVRKCPHRR